MGDLLKEPSRSRAYPSIDLQEAMTVLLRLIEELGFEENDRDSIARLLGYANGSSGIGARKIAALVHFGLLQRHGNRYKPTELARSLWEACRPQTEETRRIQVEEELRALLRRAFLNPPLFREILDAYRHEGSLPRHLAHALREHGITESAKHEVARILMDSAEYSGVVASDGVFQNAKIPLGSMIRSASPAPPEPAQAVAPPETDGQLFRFFVTDRKPVEIKLPAGLNEDDLLIIKDYWEFVEKQVRRSRPAAPLPWRTRRLGDSA